MKIGVFDSGVGGLSVARAVQAAFPEHQVLYADDHKHVPYGTRPPAEILALAEPILEALVVEGCAVLVIACNTVSTTILHDLKKTLTVPLVAVEPMVKAAAGLTKSGVIAVCATPTTLSSRRYAELKQSHAKKLTVLEPDCSDWAGMIENSALDEKHLAERISGVLEQGAYVIVLGCTHYHWIEADIYKLAAGKAVVIQPEATVVAELTLVLERLL